MGSGTRAADEMQACQRYRCLGPCKITVATIFILVSLAAGIGGKALFDAAVPQSPGIIGQELPSAAVPTLRVGDEKPSSSSSSSSVLADGRRHDSAGSRRSGNAKSWDSKSKPVAQPVVSSSSSSSSSSDMSRQQHPSFLLDPDGGRNSTKVVLVGRDAILPCYVAYLGRKTVSWVRHKDVHILSNGPETFVRDGRIEILHGVQRGREERRNEFFEDLYSSEDAEEDNPAKDWSLLIRNVEPSDAGLYECQINTKPIMSRYVSLRVAVPKATVLGPKELFVDRGSTINLTCVVSKSPEPPESLTWYHHNNSVSPHRLPRGGVSIITEKGPESKSYLLIRNAHPSQDSGEYRCQPSNTQGAVVIVHVIDGDQTAAMHTSEAASVHGSFLPQDVPPMWMTSLVTTYLGSVLFRAKR